MRSLRARLFVIWLLSLAASLAVGVLLLQAQQRTAAAQVARGEAVIARACDDIADRYRFYIAGSSGLDLASPAVRASLATATGLALRTYDGVEGGVWQTDAGPLAYAFPTYQGTGPKTDLPEAERSRIAALNQRAARDEQPVSFRSDSTAQTLLLHACPLSGLGGGLTAWTMTRVAAVPGLGALLTGLGVLFALLLLMAVWLGRTLLVWDRKIRRIEATIAGAGPDGIPTVAATGETELDRIIDALNHAGTRLRTARAEADAMGERAARAERLAALGRVAAGVAHEIRNPIAAARLQGENALAGDDRRRIQAIGDMLEQLGRLDSLAGELLAMTHRPEPHPVPTALAPFLTACARQHDARRIKLKVHSLDLTVPVDPAVVCRILDNLIANAIRHTPDGGTVTIGAERAPGTLTILVEDTGPGIDPALITRLFEPFVTGRPDGTGLGLAIARELADAHGGRVTVRRPGGEHPGQGAAFALELPCPES